MSKGLASFRVCSCSISFPREIIPFFPNSLSPCFRLYCGIVIASRSGDSSLHEYESYGKDTPGFCLYLSRSRRSLNPLGSSLSVVSLFPVSTCGGGGASNLDGFSFTLFLFFFSFLSIFLSFFIFCFLSLEQTDL
jgi:hypothetical protein